MPWRGSDGIGTERTALRQLRLVMYIMSNKRSRRLLSVLPRKDEFPSHKQRTHLLLKIPAPFPYERNPLDIGNLRKYSCGLGRDAQEIEQKYLCDFKPIIEFRGLEPFLCLQAVHQFRVGNRSIPVGTSRIGDFHGISPLSVEQAVVIADRKASARNDQPAGLRNRLLKIR